MDCRPALPLTVSLARSAAAPHRSSHCGLPGLSHVDRRPRGHLCRRLPDLRGRRSGTARGHREAAGGGENPVRCPPLPYQAEPRRTSRNVGSMPGQERGPGGAARVRAPVRVARGRCSPSGDHAVRIGVDRSVRGEQGLAISWLFIARAVFRAICGSCATSPWRAQSALNSPPAAARRRGISCLTARASPDERSHSADSAAVAEHPSMGITRVPTREDLRR